MNECMGACLAQVSASRQKPEVSGQQAGLQPQGGPGTPSPEQREELLQRSHIIKTMNKRKVITRSSFGSKLPQAHSGLQSLNFHYFPSAKPSRGDWVANGMRVHGAFVFPRDSLCLPLRLVMNRRLFAS